MGFRSNRWAVAAVIVWGALTGCEPDPTGRTDESSDEPEAIEPATGEEETPGEAVTGTERGEHDLTGVPPRPAGEPAKKGNALEIVQQSPYGAYVTDGVGRSVYIFAKDQPNQPSACTGSCASVWLPMFAKGDVDFGEGIHPGYVDSIEREPGKEQLTYAGWPLYYFAHDMKPKDTKGQDLLDHGAKWYLISPEGEPITTERKS